ncbi:MAG: hypothetical protein CMB22_04005 [Euryarchaeota archaeon]|nr:hypothetical protein [Euryarchaeota archaeon]
MKTKRWFFHNWLYKEDGNMDQEDDLVSQTPSEQASEIVEREGADAFRDALPWVMGIVSGLVIFLSILIIGLWAWAQIEDVQLGGPPSSLLTWEDQYREMTGLDEISEFDGSGVELCVVDTGIDVSHPDLKGVNLASWNDFVSGIGSPYDDEGHGTAMAGIIVAEGGLTGVSPGVSLMVAKAIGSDGSGTDSVIADAVDWCVDGGAEVISLSLGGDQGIGSGLFTTDALEQSVEDAIQEGVFVVAAAGNDGNDDDGDVESPGSVEDVICVGGITRTGAIWSGSSEGDNDGRLWPNPILPRQDPDKKPELVAPGHEVPVLMASGVGNGAWWGWSSGTSAATAWVSGSIAILLQAHPELQRGGEQGGTGAIEEVKSVIMESSQMKEGQSDHDSHYGYGLLDMDSLIDSFGNSSGADKMGAIQMDGSVAKEEALFREVQAARRTTAIVPPVSSTKASE